MADATFLKKCIVLTLFFICGAFSAVLGNVIYSQSAIGFHNVEKKFHKPWFQGWSMFLAMTLLIFNTPFTTNCRCPKYVTGGQPRGLGMFRLVSVPALCDLFATLLQNIALLFLPPSVWQMTRGSILLFTALFSIFYRHKKLLPIDWIGVATTILGIVLVGVSAIVTDDAPKSSPTLMAVSMVLVIIAQGMQAFQTIVEEELLHDADATEEEIVSFEGIWGLYFSSLLTMPLANIVPESWGTGLYENSLETFYMVAHTLPIFLLTIGYMVAILGYNLTGMIVTSFSSAIHRNIYEALRSAAVWVLSVIVYYMFPSSEAGEPLKLTSLLQLAGFAVSILGSFIYNRVLIIPCFRYDADVVNSDPLLKAEQ